MEAQSLSTKRAEVEFHSFASLGEPERALKVYAEENQRRGSLIRQFAEFIGPMAPFLEIGSSAGHSSYMMTNEFGVDGFALDISADALRHGIFLQDAWRLARAPVRVAGDAANLPFRDGSLRLVMAYQMLSQFMDLDRVFREVTRVLAPGGIFLFAEEPLKRMLTLGLYRVGYYDTMKPWERKLHDWGLLGYLVRDVIGANQEESFGIRQNHTMGLKDWHALVGRHFAGQQYRIFVREHGWGERWMRALGRKIDKHGSDWVPARLLGGTLAAICRKAGQPQPAEPDMAHFETMLRCPDCHGELARDASDTLTCAKCGYSAPNEGGVYNLLPSAEKRELYPGDRGDVIDFCLPGHEAKLGQGWHELEGVFGNKYRWIGPRASAVLKRVLATPQRIRIRGHANERAFAAGTVRLEVRVNGERVGQWSLDRTGLFILEADVPEAAAYHVEILAAPTWQAPPDRRVFTVSLSNLRLVPRDN
jgi:ubiquinone/menaquinone biosynthesis C-methylase UbiE